MDRDSYRDSERDSDRDSDRDRDRERTLTINKHVNTLQTHESVMDCVRAPAHASVQGIEVCELKIEETCNVSCTSSSNIWKISSPQR